MEEEIVKEIMKECNLGKEKANYIKLLIKICKDNDVKLKEINNFVHKIDTPFDTLKC